MNLLRHGATYVDNYPDAIRASDYYALQCVDRTGRIQSGPLEACNGHWYGQYPVGGTVLAAPLIWAMAGGLRALQPVLGGIHTGHQVIDGFFHADMGAGHALVEMEIASLLLAATSVVIYCIARMYLTELRAAILTVLFGTATSTYSVAGRALWQHTPSILLTSIAIYLLLRAERRPVLAAWAGIPVALSYTVRPTDGLFVLVITLYVATRHRGMLLRYLLAAAPIVAIFLAYNLSVYRSLFSPYYRTSLMGFHHAYWHTYAEAMAANLVSPSRGLFVFTPVFLFAAWNMLRGAWRAPLAPWLAVWAVAHWLAVSAYVDAWWGGHSYGPRFFTDLTPVLALFLIPSFARWKECGRMFQGAFVALALLGFAIHVRGGWSNAVHVWSVTPNNIDQHPERVWDWHDPQFLAGIGSGGRG